VSGREVWDASAHVVGSRTGLTSCRWAVVTYWKCQAVRRGFEIRKTAGVYRCSTRAPVIRRAFSSLKIGQKQTRKIEDKQESRNNSAGELWLRSHTSMFKLKTPELSYSPPTKI
jgi:hypothetical protein